MDISITNVIAVLAIIIPLIYIFIEKVIINKLPNQVVITRKESFPLLKINKDIKQFLSVTYINNNNNIPIDELNLHYITIYNKGNRDIDSVEINIRVTFNKENSIFFYLPSDPKNKSELTLKKISTTTSEISLSRPFLNSIKRDKEEEIVIYFMTNVQPIFTFIAGGKGWSKEIRTDKPVKSMMRNTFYVVSAFNFIIFIAYVLQLLMGFTSLMTKLSFSLLILLSSILVLYLLKIVEKYINGIELPFK